MAQNWLVLFDSQGLDWLVDCDSINAEDTMKWMGGEKYGNNLGQTIFLAVMRAKANPQRFPEVWAYSTDFDVSEDQMTEMWNDNPQGMADLVRKKGRNFYKYSRPKKSKIV